MELNSLLEKASKSSFQLRLLNFVLGRMIPFNGPHKFTITEVTSDSLTVSIPYIRKNKNHINGIHACALATCCEYISGLCLTRQFDPKKYRIILKDIQMTYHYQAKEDVATTFSLPEEEFEMINEILATQEASLRWYDVLIYDSAKNHICTGKIHWQIKPWSKTKTNV